jgi:uncharacterized membrane protein YjjP (DUF1212 family)
MHAAMMRSPIALLLAGLALIQAMNDEGCSIA